MSDPPHQSIVISGTLPFCTEHVVCKKSLRKHVTLEGLQKVLCQWEPLGIYGPVNQNNEGESCKEPLGRDVDSQWAQPRYQCFHIIFSSKKIDLTNSCTWTVRTNMRNEFHSQSPHHRCLTSKWGKTPISKDYCNDVLQYGLCLFWWFPTIYFCCDNMLHGKKGCLLWICAFAKIDVEAELLHKGSTMAWISLCLQQAQSSCSATGDRARLTDASCVSCRRSLS